MKRFPDLPRVDDPETLLADPDVDMILLAGVPSERAEFAIRAMRAANCQLFLECGPGKVLTGLNKRIDKSATSLALSDADSLREALNTTEEE